MQHKVCHDQMAGKLFLLCWCTYAVSTLGRYNYSAAIAELISSEGFSKSGAGLVATGLFCAYGVGQLFSGILGDHVNPKKMVMAGLVGTAVINFLMGFTQNLSQMVCLWILNGIVQSLEWSPIARLFAEVLPAKYRKQACTNIAATTPVSIILVYAMAAASIHFWGWRPVFWIPAGLIAVVAIIWYVGMSMIERHTETYGQTETYILTVQEKGKTSLWAVGAASGIILIMSGALAHGLLKDGIQSWVPTFMAEQFHLGTSVAIAVAIVLPITNILGVFLTKWLTAHCIENELTGSCLFFGIASGSLILLLFGGKGNPWLALLLMALASTAMTGANIMIINMIPMHFDRIGKVSSVTGILNSSAYVGSAISAYGIGAAVEHFGWNAAVVIWLGCAMLALMACFMGRSRWSGYRSKDL